MERADRDRPAAASVRSVSQVLCSAGRARAFLESGAEQDGSGWPLCLCSFCAARLPAAAWLVRLRLVPVQLCTAFLYFWMDASLLLGPSAAISAPSLCVSLSRLEKKINVLSFFL